MSEKKAFKCSKCGSCQFLGNLRMHVVVVVDGENNFIKHHKEVEESYANEEPHGPYECCECGALYNEIGG
jgi:DNA-directed RNA polymerase subunit RPC12/RpoP